DRRAESSHRERLVRSTAVRHRGALQNLCGELQGRSAYERHRRRGAGDGRPRDDLFRSGCSSGREITWPRNNMNDVALHEEPLPFSREYRAAGVLLHIASLPSQYGIGDVGPAALAWVDRLHEAGQSWWQALPLGPTGYGNSPYQALSSFAGNELL